MQKKATALLVSTGLAGAVAGGVLMGTLSANAADSGSTSGSTSYAAPQAPGNGAGPNGAGNNQGGDPSQPMRSDEKLLTGTTKDKVTAAVKAKYPDATLQRVETDSDGVYEAHVLDNGKPVIVQVGADFQVTGTRAMPAGPMGNQPAAQ